MSVIFYFVYVPWNRGAVSVIFVHQALIVAQPPFAFLELGCVNIIFMPVILADKRFCTLHEQGMHYRSAEAQNRRSVFACCFRAKSGQRRSPFWPQPNFSKMIESRV